MRTERDNVELFFIWRDLDLVVLSADQQDLLKSVTRARAASARTVERAWIILLAGGGLQDRQIAAVLKITPEKAARWRNQFLDGCLKSTEEARNPFLDGGLAALYQDARLGRPPMITPAKVQEVIRKTTQETPPTRLIGARAAWQRPQASAKRACVGSGINMV